MSQATYGYLLGHSSYGSPDETHGPANHPGSVGVLKEGGFTGGNVPKQLKRFAESTGSMA